jgi:hypothetical protein
LLVDRLLFCVIGKANNAPRNTNQLIHVSRSRNQGANKLGLQTASKIVGLRRALTRLLACLRPRPRQGSRRDRHDGAGTPDNTDALRDPHQRAGQRRVPLDADFLAIGETGLHLLGEDSGGAPDQLLARLAALIGAALIGEDGVRDITIAPRNDAAAVDIGSKSRPFDIRLRP